MGLATHPACHAPRERSLPPLQPGTARIARPPGSGELAGMTGVHWDSKGPKLARAGVQSQQSAAPSASPGHGGEHGHRGQPPANPLSAARRPPPPRSRPARETSLSSETGAGWPAVVCVAPLLTLPARSPGSPGRTSAPPPPPPPPKWRPGGRPLSSHDPRSRGPARARPSRTRHAASPAPRAGLGVRSSGSSHLRQPFEMLPRR